ncbi:MAG TPA: SBBP repeat-containing protein [Saprospiraceae bacterium]|nr:SBBP repeat-containing protein [Saprospiraceae bacterium]
MKNAILLAVTMAASCVCAMAQPTLAWQSCYHGAIANDQPNVMAVDAAGNVYVTGYTDTLSYIAE